MSALFDTVLTPRTVEEYGRRSAAWSAESLAGAVDHEASRAGAKVAVTGAGPTYTYGDLAERSTAVALALLGGGTRRGDVVMSVSSNRTEAAVLAVAADRVGAVLCPVFPGLGINDLAAQITVARPRAVFVVPGDPGVDEERVRAAVAAAAPDPSGRGDAPIVAMADGSDDGSWTRWAGPVGQAGETGPDAGLDGLDAGQARRLLAFLRPRPWEPTVLLFTSGSTGAPKGVVHTAGTLAAALRSTLDRHRLGRGDVFHVGIPITFTGGQVLGLRLGLHARGTVVLQGRWDVGTMLDLVDQHRVTYSLGPPTQLVDVVRCDQATPERLSSLRYFSISGAPLHPDVVRVALELVPDALRRGYGMSECPRPVSTPPGTRPEELLAFDGTVHPEMTVEVRDPEGNAVAPGEEGELFLFGPFLFAGYANGSAFTRASFDGDLFATGDLGILDEWRRVRITGRKKNLIIRGGINIPVEHVERVLTGHPRIRDVIIVSRPDDRLGERAVACVAVDAATEPAGRCTAGSVHPLTLADLQAFLREEGVTKQYWPEDVMLFDRLPLTNTGKLHREELRRLVRGGAEEVA